MKMVRSARGLVSGRVQGVGFRYFVMRHAQAEKVCGYVRNLNDGRVEFLLQGEADSVSRVIGHIRVGPDYARVSELQLDDCDTIPGITGFAIRR
ncbi:MAG: acylphosphatase [Gammaproteobacteria bacterium]